MTVTYYVWNEAARQTALNDTDFAAQNKGIYSSNYVQIQSSTGLPYANIVLFQTDKGQTDDQGQPILDIASGISVGGGYVLTADHLFRSFGAPLVGNTSWAWRGYVAPSDTTAAPDPSTATAQISIDYTTTNSQTGGPADSTKSVWELERYSNGSFQTSDLALVKASVGYTPQSDVSNYGLVAVNKYDQNRWSSASSIGYAGLNLSATYVAGSSPAPTTMYELPFSNGITVSGSAWSANVIGAAGNSGGPLILKDKDGNYFVAGVLTYANATGLNGAAGNQATASQTGGRLLTNREIFQITTQIKKASAQQNGWWDSQPENIYYASDDSPDFIATDDRTDIVYGGLSDSTVVGSLGDDKYIGDPSTVMKVRYEEEDGDEQDVKDEIAEIKNISVTLEVGNSRYGDMTVDVADTSGDVSHQFLADVGELRLSDGKDTLSLTQTALQYDWNGQDWSTTDCPLPSCQNVIGCKTGDINNNAISDYAYVVSEAVTGSDPANPQYISYWKLASGTLVTDAEG